MHDVSVKEPKYSRLVILVCNSPYNFNILHLKIKLGIEKAWQEKQNDPLGERIHIIHLDKDDSIIDKKFEPLRQIDNHSKIYIVGHAKSGSEIIRSDPVYFDFNEKTKKLTRKQHEFSYIDIANILLANIQNPAVIFNRNISEAAQLNFPERKLKIGVFACYSSVDKSSFFGKKTKKSFAYNLMNYLINETPQILNCDIEGTRGSLWPIPTKPNSKNFLQLLMNPNKSIADRTLGFHKRYQSVKGHRLLTLFPRHQPKNISYKCMHKIAADTTDNEIQAGKINQEQQKLKKI